MVIRTAETSDALRINGNGGDDTIDASALPNAVRLTADGGAGNDTLLGSHGSDLVLGGAGNDLAFLGDGDDTFVWNAGDGSDRIEGMAGTDTLNFNGSIVGENIAVSANGPQVRLTDDVGNVTMNLDGIEQAALSPLGGADSVVVNDLTGTALAHLKVTNIVDGQPDSVTVNGSNNADAIAIAGDLANGITITGLAADVRVAGEIGLADGLRINGNGGSDHIDAALDTPMILSADGGAQQDIITINRTSPDGVARVLPSSGDDTVNLGANGLGIANVSFNATQRLGALNIGTGGAAFVTPGGATVLTVTSLDVTGSGVLDLANNALVVDYSGGSPIGRVQSLLKSGYNAGAWNGRGINSSLSNASTFALGYGEASDVAPGGTFAGQNVDATSVVVKFTRYGDANLDGAVNGADFAHLAGNFGRTGRLWIDGDFNYDQSVNGADFALLGGNFGKSAPPAQASVFGSLSRRRRR
jgi:hypothetical protein